MKHDLIPFIREAAQHLLPDIIGIRHELHMYPELSFNEAETSKRIQRILQQHDIAFTTGWAEHGIVASIKGIEAGPLVMLRADMDALPILEANTVSYASKNQGVMHACGHDVHMSSLLGAGILLKQFSSSLKGEVRMVFQPGEEKLPGGASLLIKEGLFANDKPERMFGQHVFQSLPAGHVGFRSGMYMASSDELYITITGKGGHAATPHLCVDPIPIASRIVLALQELISRYRDPIAPGVLTIGKMYTDGGATNVIPDVVRMEGTFRAQDEGWRADTHRRIKQMVSDIARSSDATADVRIERGYPSLYNNEVVTESARKEAIEFLGEDKVHDLPARMTSEDFAYYSHEVPSCFYRLGTGWTETEKNHQVHTSRFDIDESALATGMGLMAYLSL